MLDPAVPGLLAKRRDRAIAVVLGVKERECDQYLPPVARAKLRKVVLDQFNELYELTLDLFRSFDSDGVVLNELYLERLAALHQDVEVIRSLLEAS